jgi:hypothetical protein
MSKGQSAEGKEKMPNDRNLFRALRHFALSSLLFALSSLPLALSSLPLALSSLPLALCP